MRKDALKYENIPINEYSTMNGYKYGAESCTIVPMILTRPQLELLEVEAEAINACGNSESKLSSSVTLCDNPEKV